MPVYETKKATKDGRKYYFSCYYVDKYGIRKKYKSKKYSGKRECERAERKFLDNTEYKDLTDYDVMFEDVFNEWLEYKSSSVKTSTYYSIEHRLKKHILSFFEKYKLHSIKINNILLWKKELMAKNLCIDNTNKIIKYFQKILMYAVNNYDYDIKIVSKLQVIKDESVKKENTSNWNFWTYEDFKKFINVVDDDYFRMIFIFLYYTGVRIGELLALNWNDIDFIKKTLRINKTLSVKVNKERYIITSPKTKNSNRIIDLDDKLIKLLEKHYKEESKIYKFNKSFFVFGNLSFLSQTTLRRHLNNNIKKSKVKYITIHGFRHSHASLLINLGLDSRDVAERLGDTVQMVENTYYHMFPQKKSNTVNALNKLNRKL